MSTEKTRMDLEQIRRHWQQVGEQMPLAKGATPTTRDPYLGEIEEDYVLQYLHKNGSVLEVGCGDASHTLKYAQSVNSIWAVDVADSLIKLARQRSESAKIRNIEFVVGSVLDIGRIFTDKVFDSVISQRCLINLSSWAYQKKALLEIHRVLAPGGLLLMTEGFQDELDNLNRLRKIVGLPMIAVVDYNRNLVHSEFDAFVSQYFNIERVHDYGLYLFLSRVYHPLVVLPEQPKHDSRLNEVAHLLGTCLSIPELKQLSYNLFYVLKKK